LNNPAWKDIAESAGVAAIIGSLIFVGLELRQQQEIALAAQYQERARTGFDYFFGVSEKPIWQKMQADTIRRRYDVSQLSARDRELFEEGTDKELTDWWIVSEINLMIYDNLHFQYVSGFSSEEIWQSQRDRLKFMLQFNSFTRQQIKLAGSRYRQSFVDVANDLIAEIESAVSR